LALLPVAEHADASRVTCVEDAPTTVNFSKAPFVVGLVLAGLFTVVFLLWIVFDFDGARVTDGVDDVGELVAALIAAVACGVAARRTSVGRTGWALLAASSFAWAVGETLWTYYDLIEGVQVPFPSLADAGFLTAVPLACAGLLFFPSSRQRTAHRLQGLLDGCIIATSLLFASWATILGPLYRSHNGGVLKQVLSLAYPMSDVVMVSLVIILIARTGRRGWMSLGLVMIGIVAFAVADSSFSYLTEVNNYGSGNFLDTGWVAGYLLIGLGALWAMTSPSSRPVEHAEESTVSLMAPYVPVLVVLAVTSIQLLRGRHIEPVAWSMAFVLVLLVLGREALRLWDQASAARLRSLVAQKTDGPLPRSWRGEFP
jgi:diguanylate cyclase